jgi:hypothetical protein
MSTIDDFQQQILERKEQGWTHETVLFWLRNHMGCQTSIRTLNRRLQDWNFRRNTAMAVTPAIVEEVRQLYFHHYQLSDAQIACQIRDEEGNSPTTNQVIEIRHQHGFTRRARDAADLAERSATTRLYVQDALNNEGRSWGIRWMITHFRRRLGHHARYADVAASLREFDPVGVASRTPGLRKIARQENYITAGPNEIWSLDGHDKLFPFGFGVYAGIDAFSRKILWIYVGTAHKASICVVWQYLQACRIHNVCPRYIRIDKGSETVLMAAAHLAFYIEVLAAEGVQLDDVQLRHAVLYGTSPHNVRIERLWLTTWHTTTRAWGRLF